MPLKPVSFSAMAQLPVEVQEFIRQVRTFISSGVGSIPWASVDKSGANLNELPTRLHSSLQSIQGGSVGNQYHLTAALKGSKVQDFGSIAGGALDSTTIAVAGATVTSAVALGYSSAPETGIEFRAYVSSADTVTLQAINRTAGPIDPASRTYYVMVLDN